MSTPGEPMNATTPTGPDPVGGPATGDEPAPGGSVSATMTQDPPRRTSRGPSKAWVSWLARRGGLAVLTLWLVSLIVFFATSALGDPVRAILGKDFAVSPERVAAIRQALDLDKPLLERYWIWLTDLLRGNLGTSLANGVPVSELIGDRVINSLFLVLLVGLIMIPLSIGLAVLSAHFRGGPIDNVIQVITLALAGVPEFVTGILLVAFFSTTVFTIFPAVTVLPVGARPWNSPMSMVLPVATLVVALVPYLTRILRSTMIEALDSDYVELARLKGIPERRVLRRHALPNTTVPTIQVTALQLAWLVGGVVLIEYLFNYPGIGATLVDSVRNSDFPMVQALTMIIAGAYVMVNLIADVLSILATPRARTEMAG
ncbi:ABC transporter permease [Gephyromycinifex aptenodytis]|uniref:ABC transporter permease n=1 Tax=Gephyromycinifex aptenodytis TaxID=2716227 RepID=UPI001D02C31B|nr:ABC transporter permease [Gephyromycinifex aptenodytis]